MFLTDFDACEFVEDKGYHGNAGRKFAVRDWLRG